ncbi:MAG: NAD(+) diphosphatase, partial [Natronospirillum sp.]
AEQAVHREVHEEVNVKLDNLRYLNSQTWPFPHQLMLGFIADYVSGDIRIQPDEIADAQWWSIDQLPQHPPPHTISGYLIQQYLNERKHHQ